MADSAMDKAVDRLKHLSTRTIVISVIAVVAVIFIFQNTHESHVHLLFWQVNRPLWLWLLLVFAAGFLVGSLFPWFRRHPRSAPATDPTNQ